MASKIRKNEAYSKLMLEEGSQVVVDEDLKYEMKLPDWADEEKVKMGQRFFFLNLNAMIRALFICFYAAGVTETITKILMFTKQSSTPALAYRRFKANGLHAQTWYRYPIKEGTRAWRSLETIRKMHVVVNRRALKAGVGFISQKDMAITQFTFMGFNLLCAKEFGIVGTREQFEAFNHLHRLIGYMLGTEDKYNCCGETLDETLGRLEAIREDMLLPGMVTPFDEFEGYMRTTAEGLWHSDPQVHYETIMFQTKRYLKVPGYHFFESEAMNVKGTDRAFDNLSLYTRLRVLIEIVVYEYLSSVFIFRWTFNIMRIFASLLHKFPVLALWSYGKKYAYVEIMKSKNA